MGARVTARDASGFTLVEALVTVGLLGLLLLAALPQASVPGTLHVRVTADQVAVDLRLARQLAIARRVNYLLVFSPAAPPYTSYTVRAESTAAAEPDFPKEIPAEVAVGGQPRFRFYPTGCADGGGGSGSGPCAGSDAEITLAAGGDTARVRVFGFRGRVRVDQP